MHQIRTLQDLRKARDERRSVRIHSVDRFSNWNTPRPAAFVLNLSGEIILRLIETGLYIHQPKSKRYGNSTSNH